MTFYQELQLSSTGSKQLIKNTTETLKQKLYETNHYNFMYLYCMGGFHLCAISLYAEKGNAGGKNKVSGIASNM